MIEFYQINKKLYMSWSLTSCLKSKQFWNESWHLAFQSTQIAEHQAFYLPVYFKILKEFTAELLIQKLSINQDETSISKVCQFWFKQKSNYAKKQ